MQRKCLPIERHVTGKEGRVRQGSAIRQVQRGQAIRQVQQGQAIRQVQQGQVIPQVQQGRASRRLEPCASAFVQG